MNLFNKKKASAKAKPGAKQTPKKKFLLSRKQKIIAIVGGVLVLGGAGYWAYSIYGLDAVGAGGCRSHTYSKGASSICVKYAAKMLNATPNTGKDIKDADTSFGSQTKAKTIAFQQHFKLGVDGKIGPQTWKKLCQKSNASASIKKAAGCVHHSSGPGGSYSYWD